MKERTIKEKIVFSGVGVHSGKLSTITLYPERDGGVRFLKDDIVIPATIDTVVESDRGVVLSSKGGSVGTIEHLLAALYGCKINHLSIEVDGEEIPALDGSAFPFVEKLASNGFLTLDTEKNIRYLSRSYSVDGRGCFALARPSENFEIHYIISYEHPLLFHQEYLYNGKSDFIQDIARARTYGLLSWKEDLQSRGYALSASTDNTLIYNEYKTINKPRYLDEAVRHKILDFLGDLYLMRPIPVGSYTILRGGHQLHIKLLKEIKKGENIEI